ncbi:MAG TPA: hypothetical protein VL463_13885 [Kofleriaceae bacterium]|jgi:hypothetical protein|nr:hypothetical protein [Kofleriaceae bacterium]
MSDFNDQIAKLVNDFVAQVSALARQAAMETLQGALGGALPSGGVRRGRPPGSGAVASLGMARRAKGAKRPADEIERTKERLYDFIKGNPGQRVEQINKALGTTTKDLTLPLKKLIADKAVKTEGEKRATAYFPGEGSPSAGGGRKRGRRKKKS